MPMNIIKFFGKSKESETLKLLKKHAGLIVEAKTRFLDAYDTMLKKDQNMMLEKIKLVSEAEHKADQVVKVITKNMYDGAFISTYRSSLFRIVEEIDNVADKMQNAAKMMRYLHKAKLNQNLRKILNEMKELAAESVDTLNTAVLAFLEEKDDIFMMTTQKVNEIEEKVDRLQEKMDDELILKQSDHLTIHLFGRFGHYLEAVTDAADNACDALEALKIMMKA